MNKKDREDGVFERAAEIFDLPGDVVADMPRIVITGCRELLMENHKGILEYGSDGIDVGGNGLIVRIKGEGLELRAMNAQEVLITGVISNIEFVF